MADLKYRSTILGRTLAEFHPCAVDVTYKGVGKYTIRLAHSVVEDICTRCGERVPPKEEENVQSQRRDVTESKQETISHEESNERKAD